MLEGPALLLILALAIAFIVLATAKWKLHPFLALIFAGFATGIAVGLNASDVVTIVALGFGSTLSSIGIVVACGTIIGVILEKSGGAFALADAVLKIVGEKRSALAMSITGFVTSMVVFCDSGFVILSSINKALSQRARIPIFVLAVALSTGLYSSHCLIPPAAGPIAASEGVGANVGLVILVGIVVGTCTMIAGNLWATKVIAPQYTIKKVALVKKSVATAIQETVSTNQQRPAVWKAFAPIGIPIILIALNSIFKLILSEGTAKDLLALIGHPVSALLIGVVIAMALLAKKGDPVSDWVGIGIKNAAPIIIITGAGGAFGAILRFTPIGPYMGEALAQLNIGILIPFLISAALKIAQGSSTVSLITTAAIVNPLLPSLGLESDMAKALVVSAIGVGSMTVSHANDSYFWVVSQFSGMDVKTAYKCQTGATAVMGIVGIIVVGILAAILL
ncbi:MAG: GntP family permease [Candidatus Thermoplasmatota archaeon]|nr:GntP family permease [Candidatus Thermoplasmatota archaeon]